MTRKVQSLLSDNDIVIFELNRPEAANAFDLVSTIRLKKCLKQAVGEKRKGLIITSKNPKIFCSGGDIKAYAKLNTKSQGVIINNEIRKILNSLAHAPIVVVAAVEGVAVGGGVELLLACDQIVASQTSRFAFKQAALGLTPGWGGTQKLLNRVSKSVALDWLLSARFILAHEAFEHGLIDQLVMSGDALTQARNLILTYWRTNPALTHDVLGRLKKTIALSGIDEERAFNSLWFAKNHRDRLAEALK
jgi:enoyl-CoA hydratase/carnithine racemase